MCTYVWSPLVFIPPDFDTGFLDFFLAIEGQRRLRRYDLNFDILILGRNARSVRMDA